MAQFQRKYQNGDRVILSNPVKARTHFLNGVFTVTQYDGSVIPYRIINEDGYVLWVTTREISHAPAIVEDDFSQLPIDEFTAPTSIPKIEPIDYNALAFEKMQLGIGDRVRFDFSPTKEMGESLGFHQVISDYLKNNLGELSKYIGKKGHVTSITTMYPYVTVKFDDNKNLPVAFLGLTLTKRKVEIGKFKASEHRNVTIFNTGIYIDMENDFYTFEFFDKLWEIIKEHKKNPRTGGDRRIEFNEGSFDSGILRDTYIEVGCQKFPYENVRRLMAAIRVARSI